MNASRPLPTRSVRLFVNTHGCLTPEKNQRRPLNFASCRGRRQTKGA